MKIPVLLTAVREALIQPASGHSSGVLALTGENFESLGQRLEQLRVDLGARSVIFGDTTGRLLTYSGSMHGMESSTLALLGGNMAAVSELSRHLDYPRTVHMSYFEGPPTICTLPTSGTISF